MPNKNQELHCSTWMLSTFYGAEVEIEIFPIRSFFVDACCKWTNAIAHYFHFEQDWLEVLHRALSRCILDFTVFWHCKQAFKQAKGFIVHIHHWGCHLVPYSRIHVQLFIPVPFFPHVMTLNLNDLPHADPVSKLIPNYIWYWYLSKWPSVLNCEWFFFTFFFLLHFAQAIVKVKPSLNLLQVPTFDWAGSTE